MKNTLNSLHVVCSVTRDRDTRHRESMQSIADNINVSSALLKSDIMIDSLMALKIRVELLGG